MAAVLLLAGAALGCRSERPPYEQVLAAGSVLTLAEPAGDWTAVALANGRIAALGTGDSVAAWRAAGVPVREFPGGAIAPAFTDHHIHLFNVGWALLNRRDGGRLFLDLGAAPALDSIGAWVRARAAAAPAGGWLLGAPWSQGSWGASLLPDDSVLTANAGDHPVLLTRTDGHAAWVNARALAAAGITGATTDPPGGRIDRRPDGRPRGTLLERAVEPLLRLVPEPADSDIVTAFRLAAEAMAERGVVEVYDAGVLAAPGIVDLGLDQARYLRLLAAADSLRPLPIRVNLMIPAPSRLADSLLAGSGAIRLSPRVRVTHVKLFADGALGSRGAALTHPYADDPTTAGVPRLTTAELADLTRRTLDRGLGVATHAIGDLAVARTLDAYETVLRERPDLDRHRLRIEHFSYARDGDFERAARLGVVLSVQSNFNALPDEHPGLGDLRVGAAAEPRVYAWDRLERLGAVLAEGSDYFTAPLGPMAGVGATLVRRHAVGEHRPDPEGRLLAWRLNATRFPPEGPPTDPTLRPGAAGDLVVLSGSPLRGTRAAIDSLTVLVTVNGGAPTFGGERRR
ncbi:MAG: amidohydrolase [Gemmatimonadales bacterium]